MIARFCSADHDRRVLAMTMCAGLATGPDMVQLQTDKDFQTLILQALNDLFRAHNVPVIDN